MHVRLRPLVLAAMVVLVPLFVTPAAAQAQDQPATSAVRSDVNLFGANAGTVFITSPMPTLAPDGSLAPTAPPPAARAEGFGFGVKGGPLFAHLSSSDVNNGFHNRTGVEFGIWFGGNRGGAVGVMGEILYAIKRSADANGNNATLHYLEIPILLRINIGSPSRNGVIVYILGGEFNDIQLKASLNGVDVGSQFQSLDIGFLIGGGVEITRFLVEVRETVGLRNLSSHGGLTTTKSRAFAILFGFRLN